MLTQFDRAGYKSIHFSITWTFTFWSTLSSSVVIEQGERERGGWWESVAFTITWKLVVSLTFCSSNVIEQGKKISIKTSKPCWNISRFIKYEWSVHLWPIEEQLSCITDSVWRHCMEVMSWIISRKEKCQDGEQSRTLDSLLWWKFHTLSEILK